MAVHRPTLAGMYPCRFHVSDMSSAHVYLRLPVGHSVDQIPEDTLEDCCQVTLQCCYQDMSAADIHSCCRVFVT